LEEKIVKSFEVKEVNSKLNEKEVQKKEPKKQTKEIEIKKKIQKNNQSKSLPNKEPIIKSKEPEKKTLEQKQTKKVEEKTKKVEEKTIEKKKNFTNFEKMKGSDIAFILRNQLSGIEVEDQYLDDYYFFQYETKKSNISNIK
jgi:hypothetical protein